MQPIANAPRRWQVRSRRSKREERLPWHRARSGVSRRGAAEAVDVEDIVPAAREPDELSRSANNTVIANPLEESRSYVALIRRARRSRSSRTRHVDNKRGILQPLQAWEIERGDPTGGHAGRELCRRKQKSNRPPAIGRLSSVTCTRRVQREGGPSAPRIVADLVALPRGVGEAEAASQRLRD